MPDPPELTRYERNALIVVVCIALAVVILTIAIAYGLR